MYKITLMEKAIIAEAGKKPKKIKSYLKFIVFVCGVFSIIKGTGSVISSDPLWKGFQSIVSSIVSLIGGSFKITLTVLFMRNMP